MGTEVLIQKGEWELKEEHLKYSKNICWLFTTKGAYYDIPYLLVSDVAGK